MKTKITYKLIEKLTRDCKQSPPDKEFEVRDTDVPGLGLRVRPTGKMVYTFVYARGKRVTLGPADRLDHEQARKMARDIAHQYYEGEDPQAVQPDTYLHFLDETYKQWLQQNVRRPAMAYGTLKNCFPELHSLPLSDIAAGVIEKWRIRSKQEGIRPASINRQLNDLRACLNRAKKWKPLKTNPLDDVETEKKDNRAKVRYLAKDEELALRKKLDEREASIKGRRANANDWREKRDYALYSDLSKQPFADHLKPAVLLSLNTGMRRGELLNLKWEDVDFDRKNLTVVGETAKDGETRHIPLNGEALEILQAWKQQLRQERPDVRSLYVFSDSNGQPFHDMRSSWEGVLSKAKIKNFRWHDLRHTFASKLVMAGVDLNTVRELLGHSDYKMTQRYAHLAPEHKAAAVAKLAAPAAKAAT